MRSKAETGARQFSEEELRGQYSDTITPGDICERFPGIGTVFSLSLSTDLVPIARFRAEVEIRTNDKVFLTTAEGKIEESTISMSGKKIPRRMYLVLGEETSIDARELRSAIFTVRRLETTNLETKLNTFTVRV